MDCEDSEEITDAEGQMNKKKRKAFSVAQTAHLNALFKAGMTSAAAKHRPLLQKAAEDTGLSVQQVV